MNEIDRTLYDAFFDELARIEKVGMMSKFAAGPGFFGQLARGGKQLFRSPGHALKGMSKAWEKGKLLEEATGGGTLKQYVGGLKELWKTPQGKALLLGGVGTVGGIGGAGYLAGRGSSGGSQNVYVR